MQTYEQTGEAARTGPIRREFARRYPDIGFSARDLHECLARFWEIIAVGPRRVIDAAWSTRTQVNRDFAEGYRRHRMEAMAAGQRGWDPYDVYVAMLTVGGEYATPYNALSQRELNTAPFLFPWLAYYALQTDTPAYVFSRLINDVAPVVADRTERAMQASDDPELFADVVNEIAFETRLDCFGAVRSYGKELSTGVNVYLAGEVNQHPLYKWVFQKRIVPAISALTDSEDVQRTLRSIGGHAIVLAAHMFDGAMATAGVMDSRQMLVVAGLAPPCIRFADGQRRSLLQVHRREVLKSLPYVEEAEILRVLVPTIKRTETEREDRSFVEACIDIHRRWEAFVRVRQSQIPE